VQGDQPLEFVGQVRAVLGLATGIGIALQVVRVRQVVDAREPRAEPFAVVDHAADGDAAEADAVIAALAADEAGARGLAARAVIGERDLQRGVDRLRSGIGEEDVAEVRRQPARDVVGELERARVSHLERRRVFHRRDLAADRLGDFAAAVAGIDAPQARHCVEDLPAVRRPVMHALGAGQHARVGLELPVGRERHPESFHFGALEGGGRVHGGVPDSVV
jgi:hypothetical protein